MKQINDSTYRIVGHAMACISVLLMLYSLVALGRSLTGEILPLACLIFLVFMLETNHVLRGRLPASEAKWPAIGLGLLALGQIVTLGEIWLGVANTPLALIPYLLIFVPTIAVAYTLSTQRNGRTR